MKGATVLLALQAGLGMRGVDGFSASGSGTELQVRGDDHPSKVPLYFAQQEQVAHNEREMQMLRDVVAKANKHPEVARKLLETWKGKQQHKETERLTPDKINPEVWESVGRMLTERRELNDNTRITVVLVHGFVGNGPFIDNPVNCNGDYWGDAINYLQARGYSDIRTVQYYTGDTNCDVDLHNPAYQDLCDGFNPGSEGTNNEDLNHVSCLLVQYLNQNFAGQNVILVGHSMGGILIRNTMRLVQENGGQFGFPNDIGQVTDAVTFNSPHAGVAVGGTLLACEGCTQVNQLTAGSDFMNTLIQILKHPSVTRSGRSWAVSVTPSLALLSTQMAQQTRLPWMPTMPSCSLRRTLPRAMITAVLCMIAAPPMMLRSTPVMRLALFPAEQTTRTKLPLSPKWVKTTTGSHGLQTLDEAVQQ